MRNPLARDIVLQLQAPPAEFLARLSADARDWHESRVSDPARKAGMYGANFKSRANTFRLWPQRLGQNSFASVIQGVVDPANSGSLVRLHIAVARPVQVYLTIWFGLIVLAPLIAFAHPGSDTRFGARLFAALFSLVTAGIVGVLGLAIVTHGRRSAAEEEEELLRMIHRAGAEDSSRVA